MLDFMEFFSVDLAEIESASRQCECRVLPLYDRPFDKLRVNPPGLCITILVKYALRKIYCIYDWRTLENGRQAVFVSGNAISQTAPATFWMGPE